jgi:hypothetical protein
MAWMTIPSPFSRIDHGLEEEGAGVEAKAQLALGGTGVS